MCIRAAYGPLYHWGSRGPEGEWGALAGAGAAPLPLPPQPLLLQQVAGASASNRPWRRSMSALLLRPPLELAQAAPSWGLWLSAGGLLLCLL